MLNVLMSVLRAAQDELGTLSSSYGSQRAAAASATARAEAAELKVRQLEKEADSLARDVAVLQVGGRWGCR